MSAAYLEWLTDVFEDAQVPLEASTAPWLDGVLRTLVAAPDATEEEVYRRLRARWLNHGPSGRQLLTALIRGEVYARRDSPMRPHEGTGYYTSAYEVKARLPGE